MVTIRIELSPKIASLSDGEIHIMVDENGIVSNMYDQEENISFFHFMGDIMACLSSNGHSRTAETYRSTLNSFKRFREGKDLSVTHITQDVVRAYERYLKKKGLKMNTVSFYMRILRATYNKAVESGLTQDGQPFRHVYTGIDKTKKRALSLKKIQRLKNIPLDSKAAEWARDMFLFSFYTRGMAFIDMAYLKKTSLNNGILIYNRKKTGQQIKIKWERCMQDIVDKYSNDKNGLFMLPIISREDGTEIRQYRSKQSEINQLLKNIGQSMDLSISLSMYVARHSWASIAKTMNIPLAVISDSMGHHSVQTTQIYLASIDSNIIDKANLRIIKSLQ